MDDDKARETFQAREEHRQVVLHNLAHSKGVTARNLALAKLWLAVALVLKVLALMGLVLGLVTIPRWLW
jgi:hypothetical protein